MNQYQSAAPPKFDGFDLLAAELAKVPAEARQQADHDTAIFIAGINAARMNASAALRPSP